MGGQYGAHYDPHNYYEDKRDSPVYLDMGDRFATFMVRNSSFRYEKKKPNYILNINFQAYLSEVQAGGGTVFPSLGLHSTPEKGSAIFWINLQPHGRRDLLVSFLLYLDSLENCTNFKMIQIIHYTFRLCMVVVLF